MVVCFVVGCWCVSVRRLCVQRNRLTKHSTAEPTQLTKTAPADGRLVVVRARIAEAVGVVHVRQVHVGGAAAPRELQHDHAGRADRLAVCV